MAFSTIRTVSKLGQAVKNTQQMQLGFVFVRNLSVLQINRNLSIISNEKKNNKVVNLKLEKPEDKPIVVMLSWLMAKRKNIFKYADIYIKEGYDVLNISVSPLQLLWPTKGTQVVASEILQFLEKNQSYNPIVVHGFSVGAYIWSESLVQMAAEMDRYKPLIDRIGGQVWDSATDITEISVGLPVAVFPKNRVLQSALKKYVLYHMKAFDKIATCHYIRASQMFHTNPVKAPALFFLGQTDPIGTVAANSRVRESWTNSGIKVKWNCFETSPHVGHLRQNTKHYTEELVSFIRDIKEGYTQSEKSENLKMQVKV